MAKQQKRIRRKDDPTRWFIRRYQRWLRRLGVLAGLAAVAVVIWFLADPLAGPPKALDANGLEVTTGVLDRPGASANAGNLAPNFLLPDYEKKAVRLDEFEGKVVFVNFWATWCTFCEKEMPDIVRIAQQFPENVVVVEVNRGESRGRAQGWTRSHRFPDLPNMHWVLDAREDVVHRYRVDGMPQSFVIDADGIVRQEIRRVTEYDEMLAVVEQALGTSNVSSSSERANE